MQSHLLQQEFNMRKPPSLLDICIQTAIDNIRYLGDVGETDLDILKIILSHCTPEQLLFIEDSTRGRDLSPVTDSLWMKFYEREFGEKAANELKGKMEEKRVIFKWKLLYQTKAEVEEKKRKRTLEKSLNRLKQLYAKADQEKQNKKIQICTKAPPTKRTKNYGGYGLRTDSFEGKGRLMKKSKMEFVASCNSRKNATTMNSKSAQGMVPLGFTSSVKSSLSVTSRHAMNSSMPATSAKSSSSVASRHVMNSNMSTTSSKRSSSVTSRHAMNSNRTTASAQSSSLVTSRNVIKSNSTASRHVTNLNSSTTTVKISSTMASSAVMKLDNTVKGSSVNFKDSTLQRKRKTL